MSENIPYIIAENGYYYVAYKEKVKVPYIVVSSKGIANGLSEEYNDGWDFGPDSYDPTSTANPPYTETSGIQEAVDYSLTNGGDMDIKFKGTTFLIDAPIYKIYDSVQTVHFPNFIGSGLVSAGNTGTNVPVTIQCSDNFPSGEYMLAILENGNIGVNITGWKCEGITLNGQSPNGTILGAGFSTNCMLYSTVQLTVINTIAPAPVITTVSGLSPSGAVNIVGNFNSGSTFNYWDLSVANCGMDAIFIGGAAEQTIIYPRYVSGFYRYGLYGNLVGTTAILILNPDIESSGANTTPPQSGYPNTSPYMLTGAKYTVINPEQFSEGNNINGPSFACNNAEITIIGGLLRAGNYTNPLIGVVGSNQINMSGTLLTFNSSYSQAIGLFSFSNTFPILLQNIWFADANTSSTFTYPIDTALLPYIKVENASQSNTNYILSSFGNASVAGTKPTLSANPPVSGTVYQNTNPFDIEIDLPVYAATSGTAGYVTIAKGSSSSSLTTIGNQYVSGDTSDTSEQIIRLRVPAGWYYEFTASGVTFGTATPFAD